MIFPSDAAPRGRLGEAFGLCALALALLAAPPSSAAADEPRAGFDDGERARLERAYAHRLPDPLQTLRLTQPRRGVRDGVGFVDWELEQDGLATPPLIIAAGGSGGGFWLGGPLTVPFSRMLGEALGRSGFSVRSLAYFGEEDLPDFMGEERLAPRLDERALEPIARLIEEARTTGGVENRCLGFIGVSAGGQLTLLLAAYENALSDDEGRVFDAAVAAVPSHVVFQSPRVTLARRSAWSLGGEPLDFVPFPWFSVHTLPAIFNIPDVRPLMEAALRNEDAVRAAAIPVEQIRAPVRMIGARRDASWPSAEMSQTALGRADRLAPGHALSVSLYDMDHFVFARPEPVLDAVAYLYGRLREAAASGHCQADFLPPRSAPPDRGGASGD